MESNQTIEERASKAKQLMKTEKIEDWQLSQRLDWIEPMPGDVIDISSEYCDGHRIRMHSHGRAQLLCPSQGSVTITTLQGRMLGVAPRTYLQRAGRGFIPEQG